MLPGLCGLVGFFGEPFTVAYLGFSEDTSNLTTYTFAGEDFGSPSASRRMFVMLSWAAGLNMQFPDTITIGGVTAEIHDQRGLTDGVDQSLGVAIASAVVPTGSSGSVVVTMDGACFMCAIGVVRTVGYTGEHHFDFGNDTGLTPISISLSLNVLTNGALLGVYTGSNLNDAVSWTGITEQYDDTEAGGDSQNQTRYSGAVSSGLGAETGRAVTITQTFPGGGSAGGVGLVISIH